MQAPPAQPLAPPSCAPPLPPPVPAPLPVVTGAAPDPEIGGLVPPRGPPARVVLVGCSDLWGRRRGGLIGQGNAAYVVLEDVVVVVGFGTVVVRWSSSPRRDQPGRGDTARAAVGRAGIGVVAVGGGDAGNAARNRLVGADRSRRRRHPRYTRCGRRRGSCPRRRTRRSRCPSRCRRRTRPWRLLEARGCSWLVPMPC